MLIFVRKGKSSIKPSMSWWDSLLGRDAAKLVISASSAYLFLMVALLLGLPLLTAYYNISPSFYLSALIPYLVITISIATLLILVSLRKSRASFSSGLGQSETSHDTRGENIAAVFITKMNRASIFILASLLVLTVGLFLMTASIVSSAYPEVVPLSILDPLGAAYIVSLIFASVILSSRIIYKAFPVLRDILEEGKYAVLAFAFTISFSIVYLLLVNQIIISGYNVDATAPSFSGYPSWFAMLPPAHNFFIYLVYLPVILVQISPAINLILVPFDVVFAALLSLLVASNVVMAHYLISNSGLKCSTKGATLSTGGSILGLTATCPTCLVPSFVSVIFGGVTATVVSFSNVYGVVLPPIISVATLCASLLYLSRAIRRRISTQRSS